MSTADSAVLLNGFQSWVLVGVLVYGVLRLTLWRMKVASWRSQVHQQLLEQTARQQRRRSTLLFDQEAFAEPEPARINPTTRHLALVGSQGEEGSEPRGRG